MVMTNEEIEIINNAIDEHYLAGSITTKCPRCGNDLLFEERGSSFGVDCKTDGCIHFWLRGL